MKARQKLYRNLGLILIFFFLQGQVCDDWLLTTLGIDNPEPLDCSQVQILSLEHEANGDVTMTWNRVGGSYSIRVYYLNTIKGVYNYNFPTDTATFNINWESLGGASDEVVIEFSADSFYTVGSCLLYRTLERPELPVVVTNNMLCENLTLTSPLGGMANGMQTFYWDALQGAVNYRINIYDNNESPAPLTGVDAGNTTNISFDVSVNVIGGETPLVVELVANDVAGNVCSKRYEMGREAAPPQAVQPQITPTLTCIQDPAASYC